MWRRQRRMDRATTSTPHTSTILLLVLVVSSQLLVTNAQSCPSECACKWKSGKRTVECQNKDLLTLPPGIDTQTQVLDLSGNRLQVLPGEMFAREGLRNLQKIYLNNCQVSQIEARAFHHLTNLVELDLSNNLLTSIPTVAFVDTPSLRSLNLNYNPIERIQDKAFQGVAALIRLELSGCKISSITPHGFRGMKGLEKLKIDGNDLTYIPEDAVASLQNLYHIELHNNPWHCDCTLLPLRDLLFEYRIPYPISPVCASPPRVIGRKFDRLDIDEFACRPEVVPTPRQVDAYYNENATIDCVVAAVPEPDIEWFYGAEPLRNGSAIGDHSVFITNRGHERKTSTLTITGVKENVDGVYTCAARNPAGYDSTNFTLTTSLRAVNLAGLSYDQIAGIILALIVLIIIILAIIVFLLLRMRNGGNSPGSGKSNVDSATKPNADAANGDSKPVTNGVKQTTNGSIVTIRDPYLQMSTNPDLINEAKNTMNRASSNGYINHVAEVSNAPYGGYDSENDAALYPRGFWLPDVGSVNPTARGMGMGSDMGDYGASTMTRGASNCSYDAGSYDSYEPLKHSTPLHAKYQQWKTPPSPIDPTRYGYPADFGLPIPTASVTATSTVATTLTSPSPALLNYSGEGSVVSSDPALPPPSSSSCLTALNGAGSDISSGSNDIVDNLNSRTTPSKSLRVKQQGVCVLPPLPSIFKAHKNPESPDEGYQEDGTEV